MFDCRSVVCIIKRPVDEEGDDEVWVGGDDNLSMSCSSVRVAAAACRSSFYGPEPVVPTLTPPTTSSFLPSQTLSNKSDDRRYGSGSSAVVGYHPIDTCCRPLNPPLGWRRGKVGSIFTALLGRRMVHELYGCSAT